MGLDYQSLSSIPFICQSLFSPQFSAILPDRRLAPRVCATLMPKMRRGFAAPKRAMPGGKEGSSMPFKKDEHGNYVEQDGLLVFVGPGRRGTPV